MGVIGYGNNWYVDPAPGWFGGQWWWIAVTAGALVCWSGCCGAGYVYATPRRDAVAAGYLAQGARWLVSARPSPARIWPGPCRAPAPATRAGTPPRGRCRPRHRRAGRRRPPGHPRPAPYGATPTPRSVPTLSQVVDKPGCRTEISGLHPHCHTFRRGPGSGASGNPLDRNAHHHPQGTGGTSGGHRPCQNMPTVRQTTEHRRATPRPPGDVLQRRLPHGSASRTAPDSTPRERGSLIPSARTRRAARRRGATVTDDEDRCVPRLRSTVG